MSRQHARGVTARCAATASLLVLAGCATTVAGHQEPGEAARHASDLTAVLLTPEEVDTAIAAAGVQIDTTQSTLVDDSTYTSPLTCLAVSSMGQEHVYDGTRWTSVRMQSMHEPVDDYAHLVHQAVVELPDASTAAAFYTRSARDWAACAPGQYTYSAGVDQDATGWNVGPVADVNHVLTATITESESIGWSCQRALTTSLNIVVDVLSCSATSAQTAATVAQRIAYKVTAK